MVSPEPRPLRKPDRSALTIRHMAMAIGVLVAIVLVLSLFSGGVGFSPTGPSVDPASVPVVDAPAVLTDLATDTPFPLRVPAVPAGWRSNSVAVDTVGTGARAVRVGYVANDGNYLQLQQSDAPEDALLLAVSGTRVLAAQGPQTVGAQKWVVYGTSPDEPVWIADTGAVRWVITGSGTGDDFRALATATASGRALVH